MTSNLDARATNTNAIGEEQSGGNQAVHASMMLIHSKQLTMAYCDV